MGIFGGNKPESTLVEQNWMIIRQFGRFSKNIESFGKIVYGHPKGCFFIGNLVVNTYWAGSE